MSFGIRYSLYSGAIVLTLRVMLVVFLMPVSETPSMIISYVPSGIGLFESFDETSKVDRLPLSLPRLRLNLPYLIGSFLILASFSSISLMAKSTASLNPADRFMVIVLFWDVRVFPVEVPRATNSIGETAESE